MTRRLGIIYGTTDLLGRAWGSRHGRLTLIGMLMVVLPPLTMHVLGRLCALVPGLISFQTLNGISVHAGAYFVAMMGGGAALIGVTGISRYGSSLAMQKTRTSSMGVAIGIAVLALIVESWIEDPGAGWNVGATGCAAAFGVALLTRYGGFWGLVVGGMAVLVAGLMIENEPATVVDTVSGTVSAVHFPFAMQFIISLLPMIGSSFLGGILRKRLSNRPGRA